MRTAARRRAQRAGVQLGVAWYRRFNGRGMGAPVLLLTVAGRRTGRPHTVPVRCYQHAGDYVVVGSNSGRPYEPQWMRNLREAERAQVQVGRREFDVQVRVAGGLERERLWHDVVLPQNPTAAKYQRRSGRTLPIAVLTPLTLRPD